MLGWLTTCWGVLVVVVDAPTGTGATVVGAAGTVVVETGGFVVGVGLAVVVVEGCGATVVVVVAAPALIPDTVRAGAIALATASAKVSLPRKVSVSPISTLSDRPAEPTTVPTITPNVGDGGRNARMQPGVGATATASP